MSVPVLELLLQEMHKPGRQVRWEHVPAHINVYGNEVANGLRVEGMCFNMLRSKNVKEDSDSESTLRLRGGWDSDAAVMKWEELGLRPMDSEELTGEASGMALKGGSRVDSSSSRSCFAESSRLDH